MAVKRTGRVDRRSADQTSGLLIKWLPLSHIFTDQLADAGPWRPHQHPSGPPRHQTPQYRSLPSIFESKAQASSTPTVAQNYSRKLQKMETLFLLLTSVSMQSSTLHSLCEEFLAEVPLDDGLKLVNENVIEVFEQGDMNMEIALQVAIAEKSDTFGVRFANIMYLRSVWLWSQFMYRDPFANLFFLQ